MAVFTYQEFIREGREVHKEKRNDRSPIDASAGFFPSRFFAAFADKLV
ncbi:MAG: hypothetical protein K0M58_08380 [Thiobacillus sp.]|nr:hypothetical protein [Thiobacillus sp.]